MGLQYLLSEYIFKYQVLKHFSFSKPIKPSLPNTNGQTVQNGVISPGDDMDSDEEASAATKADYSAVIDSVVAMASRDDSNSQDVEETKKVVDPESVPKLPAALPPGMEEKVNQLKMVSAHTLGNWTVLIWHVSLGKLNVA